MNTFEPWCREVSHFLESSRNSDHSKVMSIFDLLQGSAREYILKEITDWYDTTPEEVMDLLRRFYADKRDFMDLFNLLSKTKRKPGQTLVEFIQHLENLGAEVIARNVPPIRGVSDSTALIIWNILLNDVGEELRAKLTSRADFQISNITYVEPWIS